MTAGARTGVALIHLGHMLRQIRTTHSLTQAELAAIAPISQSQISKMEAGVTGLPEWRDLVTLLDAMQVAEPHRDQLRRQHEIAQLDPASYEFLVACGVDTKQRQLAQLTENCRVIRSYSRSVFSGIVQLPSYARGVFDSIGLDVAAAEKAVKSRADRAKVLADKECWFAFDENALYTRHPRTINSAVLVEQLQYIEQLSHRPNIHIYMLPAEEGAPTKISNQFLLIDQRYASAETVTGELTTTDVHELAIYRRLFDQIIEHAVTGKQLHKHIKTAVHHHTRPAGES